MGTILDKIYEEEDERLRQLELAKAQKVCSACGKVYTGDTEVCFECKYLHNNV